MKNKQWFECKVQDKDQTVADIHIFGMIGSFIDDMFGRWDGMTTAKSFVDAVAALPETVKTLKIRINSPGGDVFGGITIANALRSEQARGRKVETIVEGLAASAASIIAMGGSPVKIADNGIMMVHSPWTGSVGNARDLRATADILDTIEETLVKTYQWHSTLDAEQITALIHGEDGQGTWLDAAAAVENGLATEVVEGLKAAASIDPRAITALNIPEKFADRVKAFLRHEDAPAPAPAPVAKVSSEQIVKACAEAGLDLAFASSIMAESLTADALSSRIAAEKGARIAAETRASNIRALCGKAHEDLAPELIASAMSFDQVKAHMAKVLSKLDKVEIDAGLAPENGKGKKPAINISAIYAELNKAQH